MFVQDIDTRKPLSGHRRIRSYGGSRTRGDDRPIPGLLSIDEPSQLGSSPGPMLTSELEVDEKLKQMNQVFLESLEGFEGRRRERRSSPSRRREQDRDGQRSSSEPRGIIRGLSPDGSGNVSRDGESGLRLGRYGNGGGGRGFMLLGRPPLESRNTSTSDVGGTQGSDEVLGRLSLEDDRQESRGQYTTD